MFLTAFYGLRVTYDKTVARPNVTGFNRFWLVAVQLRVYYHIRQLVAVSVTQNCAEKPDLTGLLNTKYTSRGIPEIVLEPAAVLTIQVIIIRFQ